MSFGLHVHPPYIFSYLWLTPLLWGKDAAILKIEIDKIIPRRVFVI